MSPAEFGNLYLTIGGVVAIASLVFAIGWTVHEARDDFNGGLEIFGQVLLSVIAALLAGIAWPLACVVAALTGTVYTTRYLIDNGWRWRQSILARLDARRDRRDRRASMRVIAESDRHRYTRMAAEQRRLAAESRSRGWDDVAHQQETIAAQYDGLAKVYEP